MKAFKQTTGKVDFDLVPRVRLNKYDRTESLNREELLYYAYGFSQNWHDVNSRKYIQSIFDTIADECDLCPVLVQFAVASVLTYGIEKGGYERDNWKRFIEDGVVKDLDAVVCMYGAALTRHLCKWQLGEDLDESGMPHSWHCLTNLYIIAWYLENYAESK